MRWWGVFGLVVLYVVRIDLWLWTDDRLVLGLPVGLAYHIVFCFVVSAWFWLLVRRAWPDPVEALEEQIEERAP